LPGTYGGVLTPPASADGKVYVATLNAATVLSPVKTAYFGGKVGTMNGEVVAVDAVTGKHLWDTSVPGDPTGGATVVNDLVITGTLQGNLVAIDRTTGKIAMAIAQNGPGITGFVTPIKTAYWNHTPMLVVTPQAANKTIGQGGFQEVEQMAMFRDMVCFQEEVRDPSRMAEVLNRVIMKAKRLSAPAIPQSASRSTATDICTRAPKMP